MRPVSSIRWPRATCLLSGGLLLLLLLLLGYCSGLWWSVPALRSWSINRLPQVSGHADLLIPSWRIPGGARLAPEGRFMVVGWDGEPVIWNLVTNERQPVTVPLESMGWLNPTQFVVQADPHYYIVEATTGASTEAELVPTSTYLTPGGFAVIAPFLRQAQAVYAVQGWGSDYKLFVWSDQHWYRVSLSSYEMALTNDQLTAQLQTIAYTYVFRPGWETPAVAARRLTSPDGQYVARAENGRAIIARRDGTPVAWAAKPGWAPDILGWAHDSSGIYVQMWISGSSAAVLVPDTPLFKLRPLTPAEARGQALRRGLGWGGGLLVGGGVAWWLVRRWRRGRAVA